MNFKFLTLGASRLKFFISHHGQQFRKISQTCMSRDFLQLFVIIDCIISVHIDYAVLWICRQRKLIRFFEPVFFMG